MTEDLQALLTSGASPDALLDRLPAAYAAAIDCDRCVLFLRDPHTRRARATHAWQRKPEYALARDDAGWPVESPSLPDDDPMFAMALGDPAALYIEDVLSADPALVNGPYEVAHFGHRALIHAPLYHDGLMYGILEPCMIEAPRAWSDADRANTALVQESIAPAAADYVARHCPR